MILRVYEGGLRVTLEMVGQITDSLLSFTQQVMCSFIFGSQGIHHFGHLFEVYAKLNCDLTGSGIAMGQLKPMSGLSNDVVHGFLVPLVLTYSSTMRFRTKSFTEMWGPS